VLPADATLMVPWLLLGSAFGLADAVRPLFGAVALVGLIAGMHAALQLRDDPRAGRFRLFFLLTLAGTLAVFVARDAATFFVAYGIMGFAAYGLITHRRSQTARFAGRVYLAFTVLGEVLVLSGLLLLGGSFSALSGAGVQEPGTWGALAIVAGFGIKLALPGLHLWQPLAYTAAPAAGTALLAGATINAGLLGMLSFLPFGNAAFAPLGSALTWIGLCGSFYGLAMGMVQRRPETLLAYSSMSKMGLAVCATGIALHQPASAGPVLAALLVFAVHHALAKAGLFLALDRLRHDRRWLGGVALVILALVLAGAPLTSGALAKAAFGDAIPGAWTSIAPWLTAGAIGTVLLMARFLWLAFGGMPPDRGRGPWIGTLPVLALVLVVLAWPWLAGADSALSGGAMTLAVGLAITAAAWQLARRPLGRLVGLLPPGDLPRLLLRPCVRGTRALVKRIDTLPDRVRIAPLTDLPDLVARSHAFESRLREWPVAGLAILAVILALALL
jgi:formate hydrogenlyase subunit 3/multisubunit Na+/H+ antiporter MnhD subunit